MRFAKFNNAFSRLFRSKQEDRNAHPSVSGRGLNAKDAKIAEEAVRRALDEYGDVLTRLAHE